MDNSNTKTKKLKEGGVKFVKTLLLKVIGGTSETKRETSVVQSMNNFARAGTVLPKGPTGSKQQPPAKAGKVPLKIHKAPMPQPPVSSTDVASGTVLLYTKLGFMPQPPVSSNMQKPLNGDRRKLVAQGPHVLYDIHEGTEPSNNGDKVAGGRHLMPTGQWANGGMLAEQ